jgi:hypothetical protein
VTAAGSSRAGDVVLWARRWARRPTAADHELLEVAKSATLEAVRAAYHKLARFAHPDLHRTTLTEEQLEEVTVAFARVSNAYALMSGRLRRSGAPAGPPSEVATSATGATPVKKPAPPARPSSADVGPRPRNPTEQRGQAGPPASRTAVVPATEVTTAAPGGAERRSLPIGPANAMTPRALVHYRRAELAMRRGAEAEAMLHLRLAVATDPLSSFLRKALADIGGG